MHDDEVAGWRCDRLDIFSQTSNQCTGVESQLHSPKALHSLANHRQSAFSDTLDEYPDVYSVDELPASVELFVAAGSWWLLEEAKPGCNRGRCESVEDWRKMRRRPGRCRAGAGLVLQKSVAMLCRRNLSIRALDQGSETRIRVER